ncbi:hypothetical protein [Streptomyces xiaopingdaonensis]|uniref:hypothetical protein n=1 Tax=Streptomyces xiaopingdaonensis TaxID=1565415 RepID=UPI000312CB3F|nr:hypothetical protein [Streptomyces xiaopingdaonensis]
MRRTSTPIRALVAAVVLVLSVLTAADVAQAGQQAPERGEITSERVESTLAESAKAPPGERRARPSAGVQAAAFQSLQVCACAVRAELRGRPAVAETGRAVVPVTERSDELPIRHQVFRC